MRTIMRRRGIFAAWRHRADPVYPHGDPPSVIRTLASVAWRWLRGGRIMRLLVLGAALSAATPAVGHAAACTRPLAPPGPIAAPRDEDFRAMAQLELEIYLNEVADYLTCLKRESDDAATETRAIAERWYTLDPLTWR